MNPQHPTTSDEKSVTPRFTVMIPARMGATRLPGKPLLDVGGQPLIVRVWQVALTSGADRVLVATDDERIRQAITEAGGEAVMTADDHASGSDRLAEVARSLSLADDEIIVNLQGDEPLMPPDAITQVAELLTTVAAPPMATLAVPLCDPSELLNPNVVKVVIDEHGRALYFSRAPVPWPRDAMIGLQPGELPRSLPDSNFFRHVGLYAYRVGMLKAFCAHPASALERSESLEQLRALEMGKTIAVATYAGDIPAGVDTPEDLEVVRQHFAKRDR